MTDSAEIKTVAKGLTKAQREAVLGCEEHGNGRYVYQLHALASAGLMAMTPVERLQGVSAYRLTPLGLSLRTYLQSAERER